MELPTLQEENELLRLDGDQGLLSSVFLCFSKYQWKTEMVFVASLSLFEMLVKAAAKLEEKPKHSWGISCQIRYLNSIRIQFWLGYENSLKLCNSWKPSVSNFLIFSKLCFPQAKAIVTTWNLNFQGKPVIFQDTQIDFVWCSHKQDFCEDMKTAFPGVTVCYMGSIINLCNMA